MKISRLLLAIALLGVLFTYSGCGGDSGPGQSEKDKTLTKLSQSWVCKAATLGGTAITLPAPNASYSYVDNFKLVMTSTAGGNGPSYTTSGRPTGSKVTPWPASGSFTFATDFATTMTREDNIVVTYTVTDTDLVMSFTTGAGFTGYDGRVENVTGNWVFTFKKQ